MPKDPVMLLSFINTQLRDNFSSLKELCKSYSVDEDTICTKLNSINYVYDEKLNQFK